MRTPSRAFASALMLCLPALHSTPASAQAVGKLASFDQSAHPIAAQRVTEIAAAVTGQIDGTVMDEAGKPLDGVVISALGGTTAFAVSDKTGQFSFDQLPPGPYLLRAHLQGFLAARSTMVNVRPATRSASSFTLRREGSAAAPRVADAAVGATSIGAPTTAPNTRPTGATRARRHGACVT